MQLSGKLCRWKLLLNLGIWRDGSAGKSWHWWLLQRTQAWLQLQGHRTLSSGLLKYYMYMVHRPTCRQSTPHTHNTVLKTMYSLWMAQHSCTYWFRNLGLGLDVVQVSQGRVTWWKASVVLSAKLVELFRAFQVHAVLCLCSKAK